MNLQPLEDRIILKPTEEEQKGLIVIPDGIKERPVYGEVVAVGPGRLDKWDTKSQPITLSVGDKVLFGKYSGTEIEVDGETHYIMRQSDVMAVEK